MDEAYENPVFDVEYEKAIVAFDQRRRSNMPMDIDQAISTVPPGQQRKFVAEIACVDLEYTFDQGIDIPSSPFVQLYPDVFSCRDLREEVAKEHYRLCCVFGKPASRDEIAAAYDLDGHDWEELPTVLHDNSNLGVSECEHDNAPFPSVGETFCDYPLLAELGRGALARVYIARQPDLAQRWVVLKVTRQATAESDQLASLQHSGVIPVYSIHTENGLYGICMPYLGAITLGHLMSDGRIFNQGGLQQEVVSTFVAQRVSTIVSTVHAPGNVNPTSHKTHVPEVGGHWDFSKEIDRQEFEKLLGMDDLAESIQHQFLDQDSLVAKVQFMQQLAEAVGYAHTRGVVHRDLKPENILVANDGKPVILDFNLAVSESDNKKALLVGGTLAYMSPQQLRSIDAHGACSPKDDVFALGVILYQLLTGRLPYKIAPAKSVDLEAIARSRDSRPAAIRELGIKIPPSLNSIVTKCLTPISVERYDNAGALSEDLRRFGSHQVLKHTPDRSPIERIGKWVKRHPTLTSTAFLIAVSALALVCLATALYYAQERAYEFSARHQASLLQEELPETLAMLRSPDGEAQFIRSGLDDGKRILKNWGVQAGGFTTDSNWHGLSQPARNDVERQLGDLLFAMAGSTAQLALIGADDRSTLLEEAQDLNQLSAQLSPELQRAVEMRDARLYAEVHSPESTVDEVGQIPFSDAENLFTRMLIAREKGNIQQWLRLADQWVADQAVDPTRWFSLASARFASGNFISARDAFDVSAKLQKQSAMSIFWRGIASLKAGESGPAKNDFTACIALQDQWVAPRYNRALAYRSLQQNQNAINDLNWIVKAGKGSPRVFSLRSQIWSAIGDKEKSNADRRRAVEMRPQTADDWVARGVLKIASQPKEALRDFSTALRISPRNVAAQLNTAHVQAEILNDNEAAIATLTRLIAAECGGTSAIASRGILQARFGAHREAIEDAVDASKRSPTPLEMLQIAGIYAICSNETDSSEIALQWLARSLAGDPGLRRLAAADPDLTNLRGRAEFRALVTSGVPGQ